MKKEDLMIGDWVTITEPDDFHGYIAKVVIINGETGFITVNIPNMHLHDVFVEDLQPIHITEDILEKNGFYSVNECIFETPISEEDLIRLIHVGKGWTVDAKIYAKGVNIMYGYFKYVHELQHALKLCGIEKEIIL